MAAVHAEHHHAQQDVSQQLRTYHGVLLGLRYVVLNFIVIASFLVLAFCTGAGFWGGAFVALAALLVGLYFAKDRHGPTLPSQVGALFISTSAESGHEIEDMAREEGLPEPH
jgi:hypothetical protein